MAAAASDDNREVELILQVPFVSLDEIQNWQRRTVVDTVECVVVSINPSQAEVDQAIAQYKVSPDAVRAGKPLVFIICGEYKFPLVPTVPCTRSNAFDYVFQVPNITLGLRLATYTGKEIVEAFEWVVRTYGTLSEGATPPPPGVASSSSQQQARSVPYAPQPAGAAQPATAGTYYVPPPPQVSSDPNTYVVPRSYQPMMVQVAPDAPPPATSTRIAGGITYVAGGLTTFLTKGSQLVARGMTSGSDHVVANTTACERPVEVPAIISANVARSRAASRGAVYVSTGVAAAMIGVAGVISDGVSSQLRTSQQTAADPSQPQTEQSALIQGAKEVGVATAGAGVALFDAATFAARTLLTATSSSVSRIVSHKMGDQAGQVVQDGFGIVEDGVTVTTNMQNAGVKGVVANTLKQTAQKTFQ